MTVQHEQSGTYWFHIWAASIFVLAATINVSPSAETIDAPRRDVFSVDRQDGVWWIVAPDGTRQVSIGINHIEPMLLLGPYNRDATLERYGADFVSAPNGVPNRHDLRTGDDISACVAGTLDFNPHGRAATKWMKQVLADLDDWGFNTIGFHVSVPRPMFNQRLPYLQPIRAARVEIYWEANQELPDVFSPAFERRVDQAVQPIAAECSRDRNLLGYAFSDVPPWTGYRGFGDYPISPWIDAIRNLPPRAPGKRAWIGILKQRYADAQSAASSHGVAAEDWEGLSKIDEWPLPENPRATEDTQHLLAAIAEHWHRIHVETIRRYDPDHLIFGDKILGNLPIPEFLLPILRKYVDVVTIQWSGRFAEQRATLKKIYQATGKPILLGDSAFSCVQPNQRRAKGVACATLDAAGRAYAEFLEAALSEPYIIGWHHCGYMEGWEGMPHWLCANQCGFKDPFDRVHEDAVRHVRAANARAKQWHERAGFTR